MANEGERINGRFERAALKVRYYLDETAVLSCMAYVDLNQSLVSRVKKQRAILLRALHSYQACRWYRAHRNYWGKYYRS